MCTFVTHACQLSSSIVVIPLIHTSARTLNCEYGIVGLPDEAKEDRFAHPIARLLIQCNASR